MSCDAPKRDYNVNLRVGLLFVILATSALGVFLPILLRQWMPKKLSLVFIVLKQFGTGIIISTAFVHVSQTPTVSLFSLSSCLTILS
jgi:zinc transporter 1/2/3